MSGPEQRDWFNPVAHFLGTAYLRNAFTMGTQQEVEFLIGALVLELRSFQSFLFLLGSCFVPLFAVLLADWLAAGRRYEAGDVFGAVPLRAGPIAAWVAGFVSYQWLSPTGPQWWVEQVERLDPPAWGIGATLPSFAVSFALALAVAITTRRVPPNTVRA